MSYFTHLECADCGKNYRRDEIINLCTDCGKPLLARYDLKVAAKKFPKSILKNRVQNIWRYKEVLPVLDEQFRLTLGEGMTPLISAGRLSAELGFDDIYIKEESLNPTTSFKARGLCVAVSRAKELGIKSFSIPSAGNAAGALSAYAALAGIEAHVFMPEDVSRPFIDECRILGARVELVEGLITDCGKKAKQGVEKFGWFDMSTLKEPYRIEGKKTMGYEIAEQMEWQLPDVIIYPTGGGTGLIGMWKAFSEMQEMGWIGNKRPRMVSVQTEGCAPIVKAFMDGTKHAEMWPNAFTNAAGLRVPAAIGDFLILNAVRESDGTAIAVSDDEMFDAASLMGRTQGIFPAPEGGATLAAFIKLRKQGWIRDNQNVVLFNTGSGHKYSSLFPT